jgi:hypothetical protein
MCCAALCMRHPLKVPYILQNPPNPHPSQISHDDRGNTSVSFLEWVEVGSQERVQELLARAMKQVGRRKGTCCA